MDLKPYFQMIKDLQKGTVSLINTFTYFFNRMGWGDYDTLKIGVINIHDFFRQ